MEIPVYWLGSQLSRYFCFQLFRLPFPLAFASSELETTGSFSGPDYSSATCTVYTGPRQVSTNGPILTGVRVVYAEGYAAFFIPAPDPQLSVITLLSSAR